MNVPVPDIRIGEPQVCGDVSVFPLFAERSSSSLDYLLFHEATAAKTLVVSEVSEAGEVPYLLLDNGGDRPVLLVGGGSARRQAEPRFRVVRAGSRAKRHSRSRLLCRSGAMGLRFAKVRERLVLLAVHTARPASRRKRPSGPRLDDDLRTAPPARHPLADGKHVRRARRPPGGGGGDAAVALCRGHIGDRRGVGREGGRHRPLRQAGDHG